MPNVGCDRNVKPIIPEHPQTQSQYDELKMQRQRANMGLSRKSRRSADKYEAGDEITYTPQSICVRFITFSIQHVTGELGEHTLPATADQTAEGRWHFGVEARGFPKLQTHGDTDSHSAHSDIATQNSDLTNRQILQ